MGGHSFQSSEHTTRPSRAMSSSTRKSTRRSWGELISFPGKSRVLHGEEDKWWRGERSTYHVPCTAMRTSVYGFVTTESEERGEDPVEASRGVVLCQLRYLKEISQQIMSNYVQEEQKVSD